MSFKRVVMNENFLLAFENFNSEFNNNDYSNVITNKKFTIRDTDFTYRIINHWANHGLFEEVRSEENKGWRKFSLVDVTWLKILTELRRFGLSLEKIRVGHNAFRAHGMPLEFGIFMCILKKAINLIIFSDGHIEMADKNAIIKRESIGHFDEQSYLVVSLNSCLARIFPKKDFKPKLNTFELSEKEILILNVIRSGNFQEICIHFKNGETDRFDNKTKHFNEIGKLSDILHQVSHEEFSMEKIDNKIIFIENI